MKKKVWMLIAGCLFVAFLVTGCGDSGSSGAGGNPNNVKDVLQERIDEAEGKTETTRAQSDIAFYNENEEPETPDIYSTEGVDIDLTQMSGTMLYSQVNYMMYKPEEFVGQSVMVPGTFSAVYSEEEGRYYFGCLVRDRAACCVLGVEFELPEELSYPEDYPEEEEEITVLGIFDTYKDGEYTYAVLRNAKLVS